MEGRSAIERALELNPDLPLAHNLYTNIQVDQGHALDAMRRLLKRLRSSKTDPELFAGLTHASRYCGLLQASLEADRQARRLDPNIHTTVTHTYFAMGDYQGALEAAGRGLWLFHAAAAGDARARGGSDRDPKGEGVCRIGAARQSIYDFSARAA